LKERFIDDGLEDETAGGRISRPTVPGRETGKWKNGTKGTVPTVLEDPPEE